METGEDKEGISAFRPGGLFHHRPAYGLPVLEDTVGRRWAGRAPIARAATLSSFGTCCREGADRTRRNSRMFCIMPRVGGMRYRQDEGRTYPRIRERHAEGRAEAADPPVAELDGHSCLFASEDFA